MVLLVLIIVIIIVRIRVQGAAQRREIIKLKMQ